METIALYKCRLCGERLEIPQSQMDAEKERVRNRQLIHGND
jgi:DNA-directed RNA polymerase subunit RPC12/RpoP